VNDIPAKEKSGIHELEFVEDVIGDSVGVESLNETLIFRYDNLTVKTQVTCDTVQRVRPGPCWEKGTDGQLLGQLELRQAQCFDSYWGHLGDLGEMGKASATRTA
jgi:hypothetical protein